MAHIEVEQKYRLNEIPDHIRAAFDQVPSIRQRDHVFLVGEGGWADFRKGDPVIRIRVVDEGTPELTLKRVIDKSSSMETSVDVSSESELRSILENIGLHEVVTVDKQRATTKIDGVTVVLDHVASLGSFIELELVVEDERATEEAQRRIDALAQSLNLRPEQLEPRKYDTLLSGE